MFRKYIISNELIDENDRIIIAFSAGPDSVFLLERLLEIKEEYNLYLHLAYVNHNLRDDVDKDIELVKKISQKYSLDYTILSINMEKFSETLARELRYEELEKLRQKIKADKIATGHNKTDNAETILFRIIRGTSINGLEGIKVKRDNIIRPILYINKEDILKQVYNEYIVDKTNLENNYTRNKIRNLILPIFKEINNGYIDNIVNLSSNIKKDNEKEKIIMELKKYDIEINSKKIKSILKLSSSKESKTIDLGKGYIWYKSYNNSYILEKEKLNLKKEEKKLKYGEEINFNGFKITYIEYNLLEKKTDYRYNIISLDNFEKNSEFLIRTRQNGDKLANIKLKKLFIDNKIDKLDRDKMPLVLFDEKIIMAGLDFRIKNTKIGKYCICIRSENGR